MAHDLVIRGGFIVDGTGAPGQTGDLAVSGGRIAEVGTVTGRGTREVDARDLVVAPGFIDPHTHYDAQLTGTRARRALRGTGSRPSSPATAASPWPPAGPRIASP